MRTATECPTIVRNKGSVVDAVELFGGYGGTAQGVHRAGAEIKVAANHLRIACETYGANFPDVDVRRADLVDPDAGDYVDPADLPPARVLLVSPSCKHHSLANAQREYAHGPQQSLFGGTEDEDERFANSERSRVSMMAPLRYAAHHHPELVFVENVVEAVKWGPGGGGSTFLWWWAEWDRLGYERRILSLNSQFFPPTPQSRDRVYIVCWRSNSRCPLL
ncbi:MAG: DNA cytosine methyltransferase [Acidimicrobiales bacterium]